MKTVIKVIGIGFLLAGLTYFVNQFETGGFTPNMVTLLFRLISASVWTVTGYGLLHLRKWSLYGLGVMIGLYTLIDLYNVYILHVAWNELNLAIPMTYAVLFFYLHSEQKKLLR